MPSDKIAENAAIAEKIKNNQKSSGISKEKVDKVLPPLLLVGSQELVLKVP